MSERTVDPDATPMSRAAVAALQPPGFCGTLVGAARMLLAAILVLLFTPLVLLAALVPVEIRDVRPAAWVTVGAAQSLLGVLGVRLRVSDRARLRTHQGFVFFNHFSWIDPVVVMAATPVRFLAAAGVRRLPLVGWVARAVGTVFVDRGDDASREAARERLRAAATRSSMPVAIAPEGGIKPGPPVRPFRYGAFEVAADTEQPVLLVALRYAPWAQAAWHDGETLIHAAWRVASRCRRFEVTVTPVEVIRSGIDGALPDLVGQAEATMNAVLATPPRSDR